MSPEHENFLHELDSLMSEEKIKVQYALPGQVPAGLSRERIETWVEDQTLLVWVPPRGRIEDALWHAARAVGRLLGFPSDTGDIRAQALLDSWAYEICRSSLSTRRAILQSGRIRARMEAGKLSDEDRVRVAYALWSLMTVLSASERESLERWLGGVDPAAAKVLGLISQQWGFSSPATAEDAEGMLEGRS